MKKTPTSLKYHPNGYTKIYRDGNDKKESDFSCSPNDKYEKQFYTNSQIPCKYQNIANRNRNVNNIDDKNISLSKNLSNRPLLVESNSKERLDFQNNMYTKIEKQKVKLNQYTPYDRCNPSQHERTLTHESGSNPPQFPTHSSIMRPSSTKPDLTCFTHTHNPEYLNTNGTTNLRNTTVDSEDSLRSMYRDVTLRRPSSSTKPTAHTQPQTPHSTSHTHPYTTSYSMPCSTSDFTPHSISHSTSTSAPLSKPLPTSRSAITSTTHHTLSIPSSTSDLIPQSTLKPISSTSQSTSISQSISHSRPDSRSQLRSQSRSQLRLQSKSQSTTSQSKPQSTTSQSTTSKSQSITSQSSIPASIPNTNPHTQIPSQLSFEQHYRPHQQHSRRPFVPHTNSTPHNSVPYVDPVPHSNSTPHVDLRSQPPNRLKSDPRSDSLSQLDSMSRAPPHSVSHTQYPTTTTTTTPAKHTSRNPPYHSRSTPRNPPVDSRSTLALNSRSTLRNPPLNSSSTLQNPLDSTSILPNPPSHSSSTLQNPLDSGYILPNPPSHSSSTLQNPPSKPSHSLKSSKSSKSSTSSNSSISTIPASLKDTHTRPFTSKTYLPVDPRVHPNTNNFNSENSAINSDINSDVHSVKLQSQSQSKHTGNYHTNENNTDNNVNENNSILSLKTRTLPRSTQNPATIEALTALCDVLDRYGISDVTPLVLEQARATDWSDVQVSFTQTQTSTRIHTVPLSSLTEDSLDKMEIVGMEGFYIDDLSVLIRMWTILHGLCLLHKMDWNPKLFFRTPLLNATPYQNTSPHNISDKSKNTDNPVPDNTTNSEVGKRAHSTKLNQSKIEKTWNKRTSNVGMVAMVRQTLLGLDICGDALLNHYTPSSSSCPVAVSSSISLTFARLLLSPSPLSVFHIDVPSILSRLDPNASTSDPAPTASPTLSSSLAVFYQNYFPSSPSHSSLSSSSPPSHPSLSPSKELCRMLLRTTSPQEILLAVGFLIAKGVSPMRRYLSAVFQDHMFNPHLPPYSPSPLPLILAPLPTLPHSRATHTSNRYQSIRETPKHTHNKHTESQTNILAKSHNQNQIKLTIPNGIAPQQIDLFNTLYTHLSENLRSPFDDSSSNYISSSDYTGKDTLNTTLHTTSKKHDPSPDMPDSPSPDMSDSPFPSTFSPFAFYAFVRHRMQQIYSLHHQLSRSLQTLAHKYHQRSEMYAFFKDKQIWVQDQQEVLKHRLIQRGLGHVVKDIQLPRGLLTGYVTPPKKIEDREKQGLEKEDREKTSLNGSLQDSSEIDHSKDLGNVLSIILAPELPDVFRTTNMFTATVEKEDPYSPVNRPNTSAASSSNATHSADHFQNKLDLLCGYSSFHVSAHRSAVNMVRYEGIVLKWWSQVARDYIHAHTISTVSQEVPHDIRTNPHNTATVNHNQTKEKHLSRKTQPKPPQKISTGRTVPEHEISTQRTASEHEISNRRTVPQHGLHRSNKHSKQNKSNKHHDSNNPSLNVLKSPTYELNKVDICISHDQHHCQKREGIVLYGITIPQPHPPSPLSPTSPSSSPSMSLILSSSSKTHHPRSIHTKPHTIDFVHSTAVYGNRAAHAIVTHFLKQTRSRKKRHLTDGNPKSSKRILNSRHTTQNTHSNSQHTSNPQHTSNSQRTSNSQHMSTKPLISDCVQELPSVDSKIPHSSRTGENKVKKLKKMTSIRSPFTLHPSATYSFQTYLHNLQDLHCLLYSHHMKHNVTSTKHMGSERPIGSERYKGSAFVSSALQALNLFISSLVHARPSKGYFPSQINNSLQLLISPTHSKSPSTQHTNKHQLSNKKGKHHSTQTSTINKTRHSSTSTPQRNPKHSSIPQRNHKHINTTNHNPDPTDRHTRPTNRCSKTPLSNQSSIRHTVHPRSTKHRSPSEKLPPRGPLVEARIVNTIPSLLIPTLGELVVRSWSCSSLVASAITRHCARIVTRQTRRFHRPLQSPSQPFTQGQLRGRLPVEVREEDIKFPNAPSEHRRVTLRERKKKDAIDQRCVGGVCNCECCGDVNKEVKEALANITVYL